jgi:hypothetical protein
VRDHPPCEKCGKTFEARFKFSEGRWYLRCGGSCPDQRPGLQVSTTVSLDCFHPQEDGYSHAYAPMVPDDAP